MSAELDDMIKRLELLGPKFIEANAAPRVADALRAELARSIAAGSAPDGQKWAPRKDNGGQPLLGAAKAVGVAAIGSRVIATVTGPEARHHQGTARGGTARPIIPTNDLPTSWENAIKRELDQAFEEWQR